MSNEWISVFDKTPIFNGKYLTLHKGFTYDLGNEQHLEPLVAYWNGGLGCFDQDYDKYNFTHWMPIPEPPKTTKG